MSVTVVRPKGWEGADMVEVESDAPSNTQAVVEIEEWASVHGYLRTRESWLNAVVKPNGKKAYRSICYHPTPEELDSREARIQARHAAVAHQGEMR